jgi:hypothetical protein
MKLKICFQDMPADWNKWKTTISGLEDKIDIKKNRRILRQRTQVL